MAVGVDHRARKVAAKLDHALLLQPITNAVSYHPLTQSPGAGFAVPETPTSAMADAHSDYSSVLPAQTIGPSSPQHASKKRRASKDKSTAVIRRSSSTPHMRNLALGTASELSPTGDKRRNKLGYHRTSVACGELPVTHPLHTQHITDLVFAGHCRRRKIRCLVAQDEPTGRCANCIRLKKECNFYPVDQAPEPQRTQPGPAKEASAGAPSSSNTSSPRHPVSMSGGKVDEFRPPFPGAVASNVTSSYEVPADPDVDSHHVTPATGCKHTDVVEDSSSTNLNSASAATSIRLPASDRHPMAPKHWFLTLFFRLGKPILIRRILAAISYYRDPSLWERVECFRKPHTRHYEHQFDHVLREPPGNHWLAAFEFSAAKPIHVLREH